MSPARLLAQIAIFAVIGCGGVALFLALSRAKDPESSRAGTTEPEAREALALKIVRADHDAPIVAYGAARSGSIHVVRPQVGGKVGSVHADFREGKSIDKDQVLFRIDERPYRAAVDESQARVREIDSTLEQIGARVQPYDHQVGLLEKETVDLGEILATQEEAVQLGEREADREKSSYEKQAGTLAAWEGALLKLNRLRAETAKTRMRLNQIPLEVELARAEQATVFAERTVLEAKKSIASAAAARAQIDLDETVVACPGTGIVLVSDPETGRRLKPLRDGDLVQPGQDVAWIQRSGTPIEIAVDVELEDLLLVRLAERESSGGVRIGSLSGLAGQTTGEVEVSWQQDRRYKWPGRIDRIPAQISETTRTVTVVILVDDPRVDFERGRAFPLTPGMFCRVSIPGVVHRAAIAIPRDALREGDTVHVVEGGVLAVRKIEILRRTEDRVVVASGLESDDILILSDLPGAFPGSPIEPVFER